MVSTKYPFGAIDERLIDGLLPPRNGKFYIKHLSSTIEVEEEVYLELKEKGVKVYEGRIN